MAERLESVRIASPVLSQVGNSGYVAGYIQDPKGERSLSVLDDEMGVSGGGLEHVPGAGVIQADASGGKTWIVTVLVFALKGVYSMDPFMGPCPAVSRSPPRWPNGAPFLRATHR